MNKKVFKTGEPIPPEFINDLQNASYEKGVNEVGHLPLPPGYSDLSQFKTFVTYECPDATVNLGDWDKNTVVIHKMNVAPGSTTYPESCTITGRADKGVLIYTPMGNDSDVKVTYCGIDFTCHKGASLVLVAQRIAIAGVDYAKAFEIPKQGAEAFLFSLFVANTAKFGGDNGSRDELDAVTAIEVLGYNWLKAYNLIGRSFSATSGNLMNVNGLVVQDGQDGSTIVKIYTPDGKSLEIPVFASQDMSVEGSGRASFRIYVDNDNVVHLSLVGNELYGAQRIDFNTDTGELSIGHSNEGYNEKLLVKNGEVLAISNHRYDRGSQSCHIGIHKDFDVEGGASSSPGTLSIYDVTSDTHGSETRKVTISAYGITFFKMNDDGDAWVTLNSVTPSA